ncbi:MAG: 23S rRNA (adenine(2030)-N(6))-methyltransferase RlmJ [Pseudomonadota bacterium]
MLSYQHAYHAGGPADLHKHAILAELLVRLTEKSRPISYLESHAGRGLYDLAAPEAMRTGEAAAGIARAAPEGPFATALAAIRSAHGATAYPGSPLLARTLLREHDQLTLCELHPAEHAALRDALAGPGVSIHRRDGHAGLLALTPPKPRRGLALLDPSFEVKDEYAQTAETALGVLSRWPEGTVMIWYPLLEAARHAPMIARLHDQLGEAFAHHEVRFADPAPRGMYGSGLAILNPPYGHAALIARAMAPLGAVFGPA